MQVIRRKPKEGILLTPDVTETIRQAARSSVPTAELDISTLQALAEIGRILVRDPILIKMMAVEGTSPNGRAAFGIQADKRIKFVWTDAQ